MSIPFDRGAPGAMMPELRRTCRAPRHSPGMRGGTCRGALTLVQGGAAVKNDPDLEGAARPAAAAAGVMSRFSGIE